MTKPVALPRPATAESTVGGITALNKIRRRNSYGAPVTIAGAQLPKIGPQRTTKNAEKLKILLILSLEKRDLMKRVVEMFTHNTLV